MSKLFRLSGASRRDPAVATWLDEHSGPLGVIAKQWFDVIRACGNDVCELVHDGAVTACIEDAAFAYVNVFKAHINVGFFRGAHLADTARLLEGTGKNMRHVKIKADVDINAIALTKLIDAAYADIKRRLQDEY